jgi:hypothetical protein
MDAYSLYDSPLSAHLPYALHRLDIPGQVWLPVNRRYKPLGLASSAWVDYLDHTAAAVFFLRDPSSVDGMLAGAGDAEVRWLLGPRDDPKTYFRRIHLFELHAKPATAHHVAAGTVRLVRRAAGVVGYDAMMEKLLAWGCLRDVRGGPRFEWLPYWARTIDSERRREVHAACRAILDGAPLTPANDKTFTDYLLSRTRVSTGPFRDFIEDTRAAIAEGEFVVEDDWPSVRDALGQMSASDWAVEAGRTVFRNYKRWARS